MNADKKSSSEKPIGIMAEIFCKGNLNFLLKFCISR